MSSPQGPRHSARGDRDEWPFVSPRLPYCLPLQHLTGLAESRTPPRVFPALPYLPPATRPAPVRHPDGEGRGARPPRGRRTKALRLEGGGKVAASPPPRLPVARGAFLGSDPRRAAKGAAGEGCRFPESGRDLPPSARVSLGGSSGFKYPPEGVWLGHFQGRGDRIRALWVGPGVCEFSGTGEQARMEKEATQEASRLSLETVVRWLPPD